MDDLLLENDRLQVTVAAPGTQYVGTRFDWTGNVKQITLDGTHDFLTQEQPVGSPKPGGFGLHNEFRIMGAGGFAETPVGGNSVKIGVGLLHKQQEGDFDFRAQYPVTPFSIAVEADKTAASYHIANMESGPLSLAYTKTLCLEGNHLLITYLLENKGMPIRFVEFSHNFLLLGGQPIGPGYSLAMHPIPVLEPAPEQFDQTEDALCFVQDIHDFYLHYGTYEKTGQVPASNWWALACKTNGLAMRCDMDFAAASFTLYGRADVICPEVHIEHTLGSGESLQWCRDYSFSTANR